MDAKASVNSTLTVARAADSPLFGSDNYDAVEIAKDGECWVSFELDTLLDATVAVPLPQGFGVSFEASTAPDFATYVRLPGAQAAHTTLEQGIAQALNAFGILRFRRRCPLDSAGRDLYERSIRHGDGGREVVPAAGSESIKPRRCQTALQPGRFR